MDWCKEQNIFLKKFPANCSHVFQNKIEEADKYNQLNRKNLINEMMFTQLRRKYIHLMRLRILISSSMEVRIKKF